MGTWAKGTTLTFGSLIGELTSITGIGGTAETLDTSTHDTPDNWRTHTGAWVDGTEIAFEGLFEGGVGNTKALLPLIGTSATGAKIVFPTTPAETMTFDGIMTGLEFGAPIGELISFSGSIKISGKPTFGI